MKFYQENFLFHSPRISESSAIIKGKNLSVRLRVSSIGTQIRINLCKGTSILSRMPLPWWTHISPEVQSITWNSVFDTEGTSRKTPAMQWVVVIAFLFLLHNRPLALQKGLLFNLSICHLLEFILVCCWDFAFTAMISLPPAPYKKILWASYSLSTF